MNKLFTAFALVIALTASAQKGKVFPTIIGETLNNKAISLPIKNGKQTVVAMVFNRSAEDELKKWLNPLYSTFMDKQKTDFDMSAGHDVNFVFIPMIGGMKKMIADFKEGTDKAFWPYIMDTDKTDMKVQQKILEIKDNSIPYIMILDKDGKILDLQSGKYTEDKIEKLEEAAGN